MERPITFSVLLGPTISETLGAPGLWPVVSARKIQEVLAGRMTPEQFCSEYARPNSPFENPFLQALRQGFTIQSVNLTQVPTADDDLLEFQFGPDAAIRKFIAVKE